MWYITLICGCWRIPAYWDKSHLIMVCMILLMYCWIEFASILLRVFASVFFRDLLLFSQSCLTLCDPMDCSTPGFLVLHYHPEFTQTHVHWVSDVIQPSRPLSPLPLLPSIFLSIRVFSNESAVHIVAQVLEIQLQNQSFQWILRTDFL